MFANSAHSAGEEQRCIDLGADCECSEPLNNNDTISSVLHDPSDTTTTATECNGGNVINHNTPYGTMVSAASVSIPNPQAEIDYVLEWTGSATGKLNHYADVGDLTDKTICTRAYFMEDGEGTGNYDHFPPSPGDENLKAMSMEGCTNDMWGASMQGNNNVYGINWNFSSNCNWDFTSSGQGAGAFTFGPGAGPVTNIQCLDDTWCRMEWCVDHNADGDDKLTVRAYVMNVENRDLQITSTYKSDNSNSTNDSDFNRNFLLRRKCDSDNADCDGRDRWSSHVMQVITDTDKDFWIGAAYEIEGDGFVQPFGGNVDVEQRCTDLGDACMCSETLDDEFTDYPLGGVPDEFNPAASTTKECSRLGGTPTGNFMRIKNKVQSSVTAASVGLVGPTDVLRLTAHTLTAAGYREDTHDDVTDKTVCFRYYHHMSPDWPGMDATQDQNLKGGRNKYYDTGDERPSAGYEWNYHGVESQDKDIIFRNYAANSGETIIYWGGKGGTLAKSGQPVSMQDAADYWIREEHCSDHNAFGNDKMNWRARQTNITTGDEYMHGPQLSAGSNATAQLGRDVSVFSGFTGEGGMADEGHSQYYSHAMVVVIDVDPDFWIGPASEITEPGVSEPTGWNVVGSFTDVSSCTAGDADCDDVDIRLTGTGDETGDVDWYVDCDDSGGVGELNSEYEVSSLGDSGGTGIHDFTDACDIGTEYSDAPGTYTINVRSIRNSVVADDDISFTINAAAAYSISLDCVCQGICEDPAVAICTSTASNGTPPSTHLGDCDDDQVYEESATGDPGVFSCTGLAAGFTTIGAEGTDDDSATDTDTNSFTVVAEPPPGDIPSGGTVLFEEPFDDNNVADRGWTQSNSIIDIDESEFVAGGGSFRCDILNGTSSCAEGGPKRHAIIDNSDTVYLSFYMKRSSTWDLDTNDGRAHVFHLQTTAELQTGSSIEDSTPAQSWLTVYSDLDQEEVKIGLQDSLATDLTCMRSPNSPSGNYPYFCPDGDDEAAFNAKDFGEEHSTGACNGDFHTDAFECSSSPFTHHYGCPGVSAANGYSQDRLDCYDYTEGDGTGLPYSAIWWISSTAAWTDTCPGTYCQEDWHFVEVYFQMNTVSAGGSLANGKYRWVQDGETLLSEDNIMWMTWENDARTGPELFDRLIVAPYISSVNNTGSTVTLWIDELTIATAQPPTHTTFRGGGTSGGSMSWLEEIALMFNFAGVLP